MKDIKLTEEVAFRTFKVKLPSSWHVDENDGVLALYDPDGVGALTVSSYSVSANTELDAAHELKKFIGGTAPVMPIRINSYDAAEAEYESADKGQERYLYCIAIAHDQELLLLSYNCGKADRLKEIDLVKEIVSSVHFL